jgi:leader peptidase (prepilin peptidase) / N-methyltransferase
VPLALAAALAGIVGLMIGSFENVVIYRLPRRLSLAHPGSRCPACEAPIRPWDNIPVVSWLLLRGRCRRCRAAISPRYPLVEAVTALLAVAIVLVKGADRDVWLPLALLALLVPIALIDAERQIIPNRLTYPGCVAAIVIGALVDPGGLPEQLIAGGAAGLFLLLALIAYPAGMGMGDVKMALMLGLFLGRSVAVAMLGALLSGTLIGIGIMIRKGVAEGRKTKVPFGVFLALGGLLGILAGPAIVSWYLDTFT